MVLLMDLSKKKELQGLERASYILLSYDFNTAISMVLGVLKNYMGIDRSLIYRYESVPQPHCELLAKRGVSESVLSKFESKYIKRLNKMGKVRDIHSWQVRCESGVFVGPVVVPIVVKEKDELLGFWVLWNIWGKPVNKKDYQLLMNIAERISVAWNKSNEIERLNRAVRLLGVSSVLSMAVEKDIPIEETLDHVFASIKKTLNFDSVSIYGLDWEIQKLEHLYTFKGEEPLDVHEDRIFYLGRGLKALAMETGKAVVINKRISPQIGSYAAIPVIVLGAFAAVFVFVSAKENVFSYKDVEWLEMFGKRLGHALLHWMRYQSLMELSIMDELTGIYNRRYFDKRLLEEISKAERNDQPLSLAILDIDHFKKFNDTYGHLVGDLVLSRLGRFLQSSLRMSDIVCRYGGEEFAIIMPSTNLEDAFYVLERLRRAISRIKINVSSGELSVTVSIGVSAYPVDANSAVDLVEVADKRLYMAKELGRNRVVFKDEVGEEA